ncbi:MAG: 3-isopropylmalate dehydratase small subunit [Cellvibrionales bacterium]|nr:3-isopropylmalate dehydratase small subunit [Cellvibrionales bacterium]
MALQPFTVHRGVAAPLLRINVDTDAIIPSREMKRVSKQGLAAGLFAIWRYTEPGGREPDLNFVLNKPQYRNASILLSGANFGCGSSREHAVWALNEFGIRAIIAPSFGRIFYHNCTRNGILPIELEAAVVHYLAEAIQAAPQQNKLLVDLPNQQVSVAELKFSFTIEATPKRMLVEGLDPIAMTLEMTEQINAFELQHRQRMPWL